MVSKEVVLELKHQIEHHTPAVRNDAAVLKLLAIVLEAVGLGPDGQPLKADPVAAPAPVAKVKAKEPEPEFDKPMSKSIGKK